MNAITYAEYQEMAEHRRYQKWDLQLKALVVALLLPAAVYYCINIGLLLYAAKSLLSGG